MVFDSVDAASRALLLSLVIGLGSVFAIWVFFELLRTYLPRLYYYRWFLSQYAEIVDYDGIRVFCHKLPGKAPLGWILPVVRVDLESMAQTHGLDAIVFLRFLRTSAYMFAVLSIGTAALLMPIYATGPNKNLPPGHPSFVTGVNILSIANLESGNAQLWGTLVAEFVCAGIVYYFTYHDYKKYVWLRRKYRSRRIPSNFSAVVTNIKRESRNEDSVRKFFEEIVPGSVAEVHHVLDCSSTLQKKKAFEREINKKERAELLVEEEKAGDKEGERPTEVVKAPGTKKKMSVDAIDYHRKRAEVLERQVLQEQEERNPSVMPKTSSAIVVFRDTVTASFLTQTQLWKTTSYWKVHSGWDPGAINWGKLCVSDRGRKPVSIIGNITMVLVTVLWGFVILGIQALENLRSLAKIPFFSFLNTIVENWSPQLIAFIEGVLPALLLMLLLKLIPVIFRQIINRQKIYALPLIETKIRDFFYVFLIFSNFVYVVVSGTILMQLEVILQNPSTLIEQIALGIPKQGVFMMKYVLLNSMVGYPLYMVDPGRLIIRGFIYMFGARTERQKRNADRFFAHFFYFKFYALSMMVSLLGSVYSTIAPLINIFTAFYFIIGYFACKYKIMYMNYYQYSPSGYWQYGGIMHEGCFKGMLTAIIIHQVSMVIQFAFFRSYAQAIIECVLVAGTAYFIIVCQKKFAKLGLTGALSEICNGDESIKLPGRYYGLYIHPGLMPPKVGPKLERSSEIYARAQPMRSWTGRMEAERLPEGIKLEETSSSTTSSVTKHPNLDFFKNRLVHSKINPQQPL